MRQPAGWRVRISYQPPCLPTSYGFKLLKLTLYKAVGFFKNSPLTSISDKEGKAELWSTRQI
jgi:hypothetical protein